MYAIDSRRLFKSHVPSVSRPELRIDIIDIFGSHFRLLKVSDSDKGT